MASVIRVRTHASAPETLIPGEGVLVPAAGADTTFDDLGRVDRLTVDASFLALLTDDAYGANLSTLVLIDTLGNDVAQADVPEFLAAIGGTASAEVSVDGNVRDSTDRKLVYWGFSSAADGSENPAAAEWQIYRTDDRDAVFTKTFANGNDGFVHVWNDRESQSYP